MATTADFKNGLCIEMNNDLWQIVEFQHVKPGKGSAFVRTKIKSLTTGKVLDHTFNAGIKVDTARVETRSAQYLYKDDSGYTFMDNDSYEQVTINEALIGNAKLLKEGQSVEIVYHAENNTPLTCELPPFVNLRISYTEPGVKGDTANNATKLCTLESGAEIKIPLFVNQDELVKVDTRTTAYVERVKE